jgi:outer membrane protein TolC
MQTRVLLSALLLTLVTLSSHAAAMEEQALPEPATPAPLAEEEAPPEPATPAPLAEEEAPPEQIGPPPAAGGPMLHGKLALSLADAIAMGLENNLNVEVQRHEPLIASEDAEAAWGSYDPEWFGEVGYSSIEDPNSFVLDATTVAIRDTTDGFGGFRGLVPLLGTWYNLEFGGSRLKTNSTIQALSPELRSSFSISVTQPLLRDLIWDQAWTQVKTTRLVHAASEEWFRKDVMDVVRGIEGAYWELIAAEEQRRVAEKSLDTTSALLDQTQTQYEVGVVSKVEVFEAEAGVAEREVNLIVAENAYRNAQDVLIDAVLGRHLRAESTLEIEPTDRPEDYVSYEIEVEQAVQKAFRNRPELAVAEREIERNRIQLRFARNQRLPQLDAQISYGNRGIGGEQSPLFDSCRFDPDPACVPTSIPSRSFGDSLDDYFTSRAADQFTVRGLVSIPIPNTAARHGVSKAELELRRARTIKRRQEQEIILEVRKAARELVFAQEGIEASERRRLAAEEQLRAERIRLEYGESTPFDVLQRERDLVGAESEKIRALQVYRTSATSLDWAQGTILQNRNIAIDAVSSLR